MPPISPQDQTLAVTGAGGFIGSHLTHVLLRRGYNVRAFVHYNAAGSVGHLDEVLDEGKKGSEGWLTEGRLKILHGDILDARCVMDLIRDCDQVIHLAALIGIPYSYRAPSSYLRINTQGTMNILEACREECPERIIITSTSEVYGSAREVPIAETHPLQAQSPYAASKIAADKFAESYALSFNLPVITLRPFNTYGPRQTARAVVPTILAQVLSDRCEVIQLGSVDTVRDLTYVEDTAAGYLALSQAALDDVSGRVFNLGTGEGHSIHEIAQLCMKLLGVKKPVISDLDRKRPERSEVDKLIADASRLIRKVEWKPTVSLEDGLARTARWITANLQKFKPEEYRT
ncbi:GDP-mannose 4,6-dehydratase [Candidatus Sumerlaeota bacterium]|nr:GDP-mannose 4,6-dehydratase [Candidatus Sumerlaeota bacterium]